MSPGGRLTWRTLFLISTLGCTANPLALFFSAPPACVTTDARGVDFDAGASCLTSTATGDAEREGGDVEGPASGSLSFSESEESKSEEELSGCVDRIFGFQSA